MPELPEVETLRRDSERHLLGRSIAAVTLLAPDVVRLPHPASFCAQLEGARFVGARRRAKYLLLDLDSGRVWALQLAIYGQLLLRDERLARPDAGDDGFPGGEDLSPDTLLVAALSDGAELHVLDRSRYTRLYLGTAAELADALQLDALGPEPLEDAFSVDALAGLLAGRRARLKGLLLDQQQVAGLGNIYVDEALWHARLHPARAANSLSADETRALHQAIRDVLAEGIEHRGTTFHTYRDLLGAKGQHQDHLAVFHRQSDPCPRCGTPIARVSIASRDTHLCPQCQTTGADDVQPYEGGRPRAARRGRAAVGEPRARGRRRT